MKFLIALLFLCSPALAQDWRATGNILPEWYSEQCCGARDCRPISSRETLDGLLRWIPRDGGGWLVTDTMEFFAELDANGQPSSTIKRSRDYRNHICRIPDDQTSPADTSSTLCLYIAPPGN